MTVTIIESDRLDPTEQITETVIGDISFPLAPYDTPWDGPAYDKQLREYTRKPDGTYDPTKLKQCALWVAQGEEEKITSYKLTFCRIHDGKPQIVPKRVFLIAGVLDGARGGLTGVSQADQDGIKRKIETLYGRINKEFKLDETPPWQQKNGQAGESSTPFHKSENANASEMEMKTAENGNPYPRASIGTITVCFIEDNAESLNGRIYPPDTVRRLIESGQRKLATPNALPITTFLSHADADNDHVLALVGQVKRIWPEQTPSGTTRGMAEISIADTSAGRDIIALVTGGYLRTESLRAKNVSLEMRRGYPLPVVVAGEKAELDGIDFTNYPSLSKVARIEQVVLESQPPLAVAEYFAVQHLRLHEAEQPHAVSSPQPTTVEAKAESEQQKPMAKKVMTAEEAMQRIHAHTAHILDNHVKNLHGKADGKAKEAMGRLKNVQAQHLASAHDIAAKQLGMDCECGYESALGTSYDPDGDGDFDLCDDPILNPDSQDDQDGPEDEDEDTQESARSTTDIKAATTTTKIREAHKPMTPEDMMKALAQAGYDVKPPKSEAEKLQEAFNQQLAAMKAEQEKQLAELKALLTQGKVQETAPTQRQTLVESATGTATTNTTATHETIGPAPVQVYQHGDYLKEQLHPKNWPALLDRTRPLPVDPELARAEMEQVLAGYIIDRYGIV